MVDGHRRTGWTRLLRGEGVGDVGGWWSSHGISPLASHAVSVGAAAEPGKTEAPWGLGRDDGACGWAGCYGGSADVASWGIGARLGLVRDDGAGAWTPVLRSFANATRGSLLRTQRPRSLGWAVLLATSAPCRSDRWSRRCRALLRRWLGLLGPTNATSEKPSRGPCGGCGLGGTRCPWDSAEPCSTIHSIRVYV